jgi:uncharacterized protein YrrD
MLYDISDFGGLRVLGRDGEVGKLHDVYFEDDSWTIRYLVVDTGGWLTGRKVLVAPHAIRGLKLDESAIDTNLSRGQIESSPDFSTDKPVSRQFETSVYGHYGYPYYWRGPYLWGVTPYPYGEDMPEQPLPQTDMERNAREAGEQYPHLRSAKEVIGYYVEATDGSLGHIDTLLVDKRSWQVKAVVVDTKNWLPGKRVMIPPPAVARIDWPEHKVYVNATRAAIESSPEYDLEAAIATASG